MKGKASLSWVLGCGILMLSALAAGATPTAKPDLTNSAISAERVETTLVPLRFKVTVEVKNRGQAYAQHFNCRLSYRLSSSAPWQELETWHRDGLNLNQTFSHVTQKDFTEGGTYYFKAEADCDQELSESSESNNIRYYSKSFMAGTPDLTVENLTAATVNVYSNGNWAVKSEWDVKNLGDGKASGSFVVLLRVYKDSSAAGADLQSYTRYNLDKGASIHFSKTTTFSNINAVHFKVIADSTGKLYEKSESNNSATSNTLSK
jgi:hypothetical protein